MFAYQHTCPSSCIFTSSDLFSNWNKTVLGAVDPMDIIASLIEMKTVPGVLTDMSVFVKADTSDRSRRKLFTFMMGNIFIGWKYPNYDWTGFGNKSADRYICLNKIHDEDASALHECMNPAKQSEAFAVAFECEHPSLSLSATAIAPHYRTTRNYSKPISSFNIGYLHRRKSQACVRK